MARLPISLLSLLTSLTSHASAVQPRLHAIDRHITPVGPYSAPRITEAPSQSAVDLRLRYAAAAVNQRAGPELSINSCATACINAAVTQSTNCKLDDYDCECKETNQNVIQLGAINCVYTRCGYAIAADIFSEAADFCLSYNLGEFSTYDTTSFTTTDDTDSTSVVVVTKTNAAGSLSFSTSTFVVNAPTGGSDGGRSGGGSSSDSSSSSSSSSSGLSTGAIAGIAVGAAAGAIIFCGIMFLIWRSCLRKPEQRPVSYAPVAHAADDGAAAYPPPPGGRAEVDGTSTLAYSVVSPSQGPGRHDDDASTIVYSVHPGRDNVSKMTSVVSTPSPAPPPPVSPVQTPSPPPPTHLQHVSAYPNMSELQGHGRNVSELQAQAWQQHQQQQAYQMVQAQAGHAPPVHTATGYQTARPGYQEMEGARPPEVAGDTHITQELHGAHITPELHGAPYNSRVYEMSTTPRPR